MASQVWINETIASVRLPARLVEKLYGNVVCDLFGIELALVNSSGHRHADAIAQRNHAVVEYVIDRKIRRGEREAITAAATW